MPNKVKFVVLCIVDNMGIILCLLLSTFNWCDVWLAYVVCENAKHGQIWLFVHNILYEYHCVPFFVHISLVCVYVKAKQAKFVMLCIIFEWWCSDTIQKRNLALDLPLGGPYLQVYMDKRLEIIPNNVDKEITHFVCVTYTQSYGNCDTEMLWQEPLWWA